MASKPGRRFDALELLLIVAFVAFAVWMYQERHFERTSEAKAFEKAFGSGTNSEHEEEWIVRDFFHDKRGGFFVDVGANHYKVFSNTYYLDVMLGWSGLSIDPLKTFEADYLKYRPRSKFLSFFVSDASNEQAKMFFLKSNLLVTSSDKSFTEQWGEGATEMTAPTITLNDLFAAQNVERVDFLSIDVELAEPKVLGGLDVERYRPALVCIEAHPQVRQQILDYFARHRYVVVGKYLRADTANLYFAPADF